jgi:hypothetical protein
MTVRSIFTTGLAALAASSTLSAQSPALKPGVTVWLYEIGEEMRELPVLVDGQTPNVSDDFAAVDFSGPWAAAYGAPLENHYFGHAWGYLQIGTGGTYEFRLTSDDGAKFFIGDEAALAIANDEQGLSSNTTTLNLLPGSFRYYIDFYQNAGSSRLLLEWKPPGAADFAPIPGGPLQAEEGLTHVTSPGLKSYYYQEGGGGTAGGPGDGRPLEGVHPGYDLVNFRPTSFRPAVGGMDFLPDGRLAVCTWDSTGAVYLLGNLNGPGAVTVHRFAEGLGEPLGLRVIGGVIHVTQKQEVTKLIDLDGDDVADDYQAVAHGWPASFNYHEFTLNLVNKDGFLWVTTSVPLRTGSTAYLPGSEPAFPVPNGPGSLLKIDPANRTWEAVARGLRTPNGMGIGVDGELFVSDNQGDWLPSSRINHLSPGKYYGHRESPDDPEDYTRPALWLPHGEIANSPAEPTLIPGGTYAGQMLVAELTHGGVNRVFMEKVKGQYQGAVFQFTQGLECGMNRLVWGPDGSLYIGGLGAGGNWNWKNTTTGLQRLRPNGKVTFEMKSVRARGDGFIVEFTRPVPYQVAATPANYGLQQFRYTPEATYGGPKYNQETLGAERADVSIDRKKVFLKIPGLTTDRVLALRLKNFVSDANLAPWATEAWYTINRLPDETGADFPIMSQPPEPENPVAPEQTFIHEAEEAARSGPASSTEHAGYSGAGYLDYGNAAGQTITWTVQATHAGTHRIAFRYANGATDNRPLAVRVNGTVVSTPSFGPTGGWPAWIYTPTVNVQLAKGTNTISLTSTVATGPNVDHLAVTGPPPPPPGATILFDGTAASLANNWRRDADAAATNWMITNGELLVGLMPAPNDISTIAGLKDFKLHLEWLSPAGGTGQLGGNSGVKLQRSYEIQVLNTPAGTTSLNDSAAAIYLQKPADTNASLGAGAWQSYDIDFTAARWSGGVKVADARVTARWNGMLVHDGVAVPQQTGASLLESPGLHPLLLQAHASDASGPVRFRNIWVQPQESFSAQWSDWLADMALAGEQQSPLADPDKDGMTNLWEYASAGDPLTADRNVSTTASRVPDMAIVTHSGSRYLEFTFLRRADATARGLHFTIETSPSLGALSWIRRPATQTGPPVALGDGELEQVTLRVDEPLSGDPRLFARMRAELLD